MRADAPVKTTTRRHDDTGRPAQQGVEVVIEAATDDADDMTSPDALVEALRDSIFLAHQLREVSDRIGTNAREILSALTLLAISTPSGLADPETALPAHDEAALREAGSLAEPPPPLAQRASTMTTVATLTLLRDALTVKDAARRLRVTTGRIRQRIAAPDAARSGGRRRLEAACVPVL